MSITLNFTRQKRLLHILLGVMLLVFLQSSLIAGTETTKKIGDAEFFINIPDGIHGIIFDNKGYMYVGQKLNVLRVSPDKKVEVYATLQKPVEKRTNIWSFAFGPDGCLYLTAGDRVSKIVKGKEVILIQENFTGTWGAADLAFDKTGNLYVTHGHKVTKYTPKLERSEFIDRPDLVEAIGVCFDKDYKNMYVGDVFGRQVMKFPILENGQAGEPVFFHELASPEFMVAGADGAMYVTLPGGSSLVRIDEEGKRKFFKGHGQLIEPFTLAFGGKGFEEEYLYVLTAGNNIYKVYMGTTQLKR